MSSRILDSCMRCLRTLPCIVRSFVALPVSAGFSTFLWKLNIMFDTHVFWMNMGGGFPTGMSKAFRQISVVPPKTRRKTQMRMTVALRRMSRVSGPSSSFTHSSRERVRTSAMPPRSPACHIMIMCFQLSMRRFSRGRCLPTWLLMPLDTRARGNVARPRPRRQKSMSQRPNWQPLAVEKTAAKPTKRKTDMSAKLAICFRRKEARMEPSMERCGRATALTVMPQKRSVMIPDILNTYSAKW
mmetsp:Transcript_91960/g.297578  ORF Transcript_91960/g.297578 Transcript_91960/m.297578 type:complete len:242 (-) Transcript_91960:881-1606(-)